MPVLPQVAHQVRSSAVPTPLRIATGSLHEPQGFAGNGYPRQVYDTMRQGGSSVAGASRADAIRLNRGRKCPKGQVLVNGQCKWPPIVLPPDTGNPLGGRKKRPVRAGRGLRAPQGLRACTPPRVPCEIMPGHWSCLPEGSKCAGGSFMGKSYADAVRLSSGSGVAGSSMGPPAYTTFPSYPGNLQRRDAVARTRRGRSVAGGACCSSCAHGGTCEGEAVAGGCGGMAGAMKPPVFPSYPGNSQRRDARARRAIAGGHHHHDGHHHDHHHDDHGGACCDSCAHGGPCEGCDGAGGCGKPNCKCS
jgi:hypothetical protein